MNDPNPTIEKNLITELDEQTLEEIFGGNGALAALDLETLTSVTESSDSFEHLVDN